MMLFLRPLQSGLLAAALSAVLFPAAAIAASSSVAPAAPPASAQTTAQTMTRTTARPGPAIADTVYYNGIIYTLTEDFTQPSALDPSRARTAEVVAVKDGRILYAGSKEQAKLAGYLDPARVACLQDLQGETMLPGFVDSHGDFPAPGKGGRITPALTRADALYTAAGVTTADMGGAMLTRPPSGMPASLMPKSESGERAGAGLFDFQQSILSGGLHVRLIVHPLAEGAAGAINRAFLGWASSGPAKGLPDSIGRADVKTVRALPVGADLSNYRRAENLDPVPPHRLFLGAWKLVLDGAIENHEAWLKSPAYADGKPGPNPLVDGRADALAQAIEFYHLNGDTVEVHASGDRAIELVVSSLEAAVAKSPVTDTRHAIVHAELTERQHIDRLTGRYTDLLNSLRGTDPAQLGGVAADPASRSPVLADNMRGQHIVNDYAVTGMARWQEMGLDKILGPERFRSLSPAGWSAACDQPFALHDDTPDFPAPPLQSIHTAVNRSATRAANASADADEAADIAASGQRDQRINILQALHAVTTVPAYRNHQDKLIGSIAPGKLADFVILDWNPMEIAGTAPEKLAEIPVLATIVGGRVVYGKLPSPCGRADPADRPNGDSSMVGGIRSR